MIEFVKNNIPTIITGIIVFGVIALVATKVIRDKKAHKSSCGCGCSNCPSSGMCHQK